MASAVFPEKRTRSQLALPDDLLLQLSQGSPLKDARTALRHFNTAIEPDTKDRAETVQETDDESLLSPGKPVPALRTAKRSVSPSPGDEYVVRRQDGRELKRTKLNDGEPLASDSQSSGKIAHVLPSRPAHTRSQSQPTYSKSSIRVHSDTTNSSNVEIKNICDETDLTGKGRARSVPLFPSSFSGIVHIDLRNPPPSPRRQKSRSPSKERELRIISGTAMIGKLDVIQDEGDSAMKDEQGFNSMHIDLRNPPASPHRRKSNSEERGLRIVAGPAVTGKLDVTQNEGGSAINDEQGLNIPQPITCNNKDLMVDIPPNENESTSGTILGEPLIPPPIFPPTPSKRRLTPLVIPVVVEPPATPTRELSPMSPLTPISDASEDIRYVASGSGISLPEIQASASQFSPLKPSLGPATITKSRLPRPSSSTNLALTSTKPTQPTKRPVVSSSSKSATTDSRVSNAFTVLMANARESKEQAKGKGKRKATFPKSTSLSYASLKSTGEPSKPSQKGKSLDKGKAEEVSTPRTSLKSKMKPKMVQKLKPKLPLPVVPSPPPEVEKEPSPPPSSSLPRSSSPAHSTHSARPTTPFVQDLSMESIGFEPDEPMQVDVSAPTQPSHRDQATGTPTIHQGPPAGLVELGLSNAPDAPVEFPGGDAHVFNMEGVVKLAPAEDLRPVANAGIESPVVQAEPSETAALSAEPIPLTQSYNPPTKSSLTKVHIPKRKPSSIPAPTRITRSVSLKRNQKASEIPKALPTKAIGKPALPKKKVPNALLPDVVATGSSSKSSDEVLPDTVSSTSNLSSLPMESVGKLVPPGSPMKLDAAKQNAKSRKSSFAQPTKSALIKQVSPQKLSISKPRGSSPSKLARSISMVSRPRASLSRSFTSYSTLEGSSLSTLSSALEKLQQAPPERPNTSMGFNRDDPDSSIEVEATSKDDSSIKPSGPDDLKMASSSKGEANSSRLVQRTLFNGPRSSLAGKFMVGTFGSGSQTRGTGGFKVPRQPSKTGPRILGVRGGIFPGAMRARTLHKASRKTSLPSVMASPVKGGNTTDAMDITDDVPRGEAQDPDVPPLDTLADEMVLDHVEGKGKERATEPYNSKVSGGISLAPRALSQSLNATTGPGLMGPPATPKGRKALRSVSSTYPSTSSGAEPSGRVSPTRTSLRLTEKTSDFEASNITPAVSVASQPESLAFLKDCVIFVDVRNDDGDDVGSLFIEMLEGVGARILTRVGQTCTHVVFKNGLMSTINRYRLLRDPKPFVVGIAWVVECVEQKKHIDEARFLVDLDSINVSGTNKRRRSMLPKLMSHDFEEKSSSDVEGDVSLDGSTSSMTLDDLTPLEKARRRIVAR
ncbi:hypothetical protein C0993_003736 [Termitomyces sp. T159_Od127]|nr:hypothetical protein C0993_003736 [Termitomyces sp. T159_Od127]